MNCPKCHSDKNKKDGFDKGVQIYQCKSCGRKFREEYKEIEFKDGKWKEYSKEELQENSWYIETAIANIKSIKDLIEFYKIDLNEWELIKQVVNFWGNESNSNRQVKGWFRKIDKSQINPTELLEHFKSEASKYSPKVKKIKYKKQKDGKLLELGPIDHHMAQLSWNKETGFGDYDIHIAQDLYQRAIEYLIGEASYLYNIEKILFVAGHDFFNSDTENSTTTKGTAQAEDSRWQKAIYIGCKTVMEAINYAKQIAPVDVMIIRGNHDSMNSYWMGMFLYAWFRNDPNVNVNIDPKIRKYYEYGNTLLGLVHQGKDDRLAQLMPLEAPEAWSRTKYRIIQKGHVHHESKKFTQLDTEVSGIKITTLSTLVALDNWHSEQGYNSMRQSQGFVYDKIKGPIAEFKFTI